MSKVLYVTRYPLHIKYNLTTKFDGQMNALRKLGYDVFFLAYDEHYYYLVHQGHRTPITRLFATKTSIFYHILSYVLLYISTIYVLKKYEWNSSDFAYIRSMPKEYFWGKMKKRMHSLGMTIIVEIPTYIQDGREKPQWQTRLINFFLFIFPKDKYTDLYALIGDKTNGYYNGTPAINIDNGIDTTNISPRTPLAHKGINLIAIGHMADWHGFDRVIEGLSLYSKKSDIDFYIVGPDGDGSLEKWKKLTNKLKLQDHIHYTGPLYGDKLLKLINECDVGLGSLGMYRKNCNTSSELKIREYVSRGIPVVYAANDATLDTFHLVHTKKVSNDSSPIDIDSIISFVQSLPSNDTVVHEMRYYAEQYMSWDAQFLKIFNYIKNQSLYG